MRVADAVDIFDAGQYSSIIECCIYVYVSVSVCFGEWYILKIVFLLSLLARIASVEYGYRWSGSRCGGLNSRPRTTLTGIVKEKNVCLYYIL